LYAAADVVVEEIAVEGSLDDAKDPHEPLGVARLSEEAINPVADIEGTIETKAEDVICGEILDFATLLKKVDLWDDCNGLQNNREGPKNFHDAKSAVEESTDNANQESGANKIPNNKVIASIIVGGAVLLHDKINDVASGGNEHNLHDCVINGECVCEDVQIPRHKHNCVNLPRLQRHSRHILMMNDLLKQDHMAQKMHKICCNSEIIEHCHYPHSHNTTTPQKTTK